MCKSGGRILNKKSGRFSGEREMAIIYGETVSGGGGERGGPNCVAFRGLPIIEIQPDRPQKEPQGFQELPKGLCCYIQRVHTEMDLKLHYNQILLLCVIKKTMRTLLLPVLLFQYASKKQIKVEINLQKKVGSV